MVIGKTQVRKVELEIDVSTAGRFWLEEVGEDGDRAPLANGDTLDEAKRNASLKLREREIDVEVPFLTLSRGTIQQGVAYRIHAGRGRGVMVRWSDGRRDEITGREGTYGLEHREKLERLIELRGQMRPLEEEARSIQREAFSLDGAVREAQQEAAEAAEARAAA